MLLEFELVICFKLIFRTSNSTRFHFLNLYSAFVLCFFKVGQNKCSKILSHFLQRISIILNKMMCYRILYREQICKSLFRELYSSLKTISHAQGSMIYDQIFFIIGCLSMFPVIRNPSWARSEHDLPTHLQKHDMEVHQ